MTSNFRKHAIDRSHELILTRAASHQHIETRDDSGITTLAHEEHAVKTLANHAHYIRFTPATAVPSNLFAGEGQVDIRIEPIHELVNDVSRYKHRRQRYSNASASAIVD